MKHGQKLEEMYDVTTPKNEIVYPYIQIPAEVFKDYTCQIGGKYRVEIVVEIRMMDENIYGCDLLESEIESDEEENTEEKD